MTMEKDLVSLKIDESMVKVVLQKQIQAAIMKNLNNAEEFMAKAVELAMNQKVADNGSPSRYSYENKYCYIDWLVEKNVQDAAKEALKEWLSENKKLVKQVVLKELNIPKRQKSIAEAFANAVERSLNCDWNMTCNIKFKENG